MKYPSLTILILSIVSIMHIVTLIGNGNQLFTALLSKSLLVLRLEFSVDLCAF